MHRIIEDSVTYSSKQRILCMEQVFKQKHNKEYVTRKSKLSTFLIDFSDIEPPNPLSFQISTRLFRKRQNQRKLHSCQYKPFSQF